MNRAPKHYEALHDALHFLGYQLVDGGKLDKDQTGQLGCSLLVLADYAYLSYLANND
ncbi:MAG: hypothetical protein Q4B82_08365 [Alysiella sp.]|uniref:hypothetical protein n=1 Tax=Alysiella sp. TaxID=1872483 RepID=UPI0026DB305B|nr:hypothetical protein [Alysiella sp.]MDO4434575.1 hypothetical protein [Alysiella sp.]